ncbi:TPA: hypothetical protein L4F62_006023 [Pseudomonas aeruginosa]|jgi:hypothetical protein|uniref:hypothetical protein n=1 Tax=Pseudomonas aeruginosa TaxID=287 RepID=UPI0024B3C9EF|nr:hypothetical protein [Pseudomonas aeruginosa]CAI9794833.1 hypothetical protein PAER4782_34610 [Pseudomonas aeruginosa]CAI9912222.1 hypothetical protein PAER4782_34610 [Pseudomonas aeruginosa]HBO1619474.1 hypothetical protein [Pseudomonas aeruginosa]HBO9385955.1 hypothetical protein [Pseudomonas aeruginosa]
MNNLQATTALVKMFRKHPELESEAMAVVDFIAELTALAVLASNNLSIAARELKDHQIIPHNAQVVSDKLEALYDNGRGEGDY